MGKHHSIEVRQRAVDAVEVYGLPVGEVAKFFNVSRSVLNNWRRNLRDRGTVASKIGHRGKRMKIEDLYKFQLFIEENKELTLAEMATKLGNGITVRMVEYALKKIGFTRKKTFLYAERDAKKREEYQERMKKYDSADVLSIDEAGVENSEARTHGWSHSSERCMDERLGHPTERISMMAGFCNGKLVAPMTF